jgi:MFS family permease
MAMAVPVGMLAGRHLGLVLAAGPVAMGAGLAVMASAGTLFGLTLGRGLMGFAHTLNMVGGLTAILQDDGGRGGSVRLNTFEAAGMLGILGGLTLVGVLPSSWGWNLSLLVASSPFLLLLPLMPVMRRRFPGRHRSDPPPSASAPADVGLGPRAMPRVFWLMLAVGVVFALSWSSVSQFLLPMRGTRDFGLDRAGISRLFAAAQIIDLIALLPVGQAADRLGRARVLGAITLVLGAGTLFTGLGNFPLFVLGCGCFGLGLAGWMLPLGIIRERTGREGFAWRTGLYRLGVDAAVSLGPLLAGLLGERGAGFFVASVGLAALAVGGRLVLRPLP